MGCAPHRGTARNQQWERFGGDIDCKSNVNAAQIQSESNGNAIGNEMCIKRTCIEKLAVHGAAYPQEPTGCNLALPNGIHPDARAQSSAPMRIRRKCCADQLGTHPCTQRRLPTTRQRNAAHDFSRKQGHGRCFKTCVCQTEFVNLRKMGNQGSWNSLLHVQAKGAANVNPNANGNAMIHDQAMHWTLNVHATAMHKK